MTKLTAKRARFCQEYLVDLNATAAARRVGYSDRTAEVQGCRLLRNVQVKARITELQAEAAERNEVTVDAVIAKLTELRDQAVAAKQMGPAVRAQELIGKTIGAFVDKHLVSELEAMTDEQLMMSITGGDPHKSELLRGLLALPPDTFGSRH